MKPTKPFLWLIQRYQNSGFRRNLPAECNFEPCCSDFAKEALTKHGLIRGMVLSVGRLLRCKDPDLPIRKIDPVPEKKRHAG